MPISGFFTRFVHSVWMYVLMNFAAVGVATRAEGCYFYLSFLLLAALCTLPGSRAAMNLASYLLLCYALLLVLQPILMVDNWSLSTLWEVRADLLMPFNLFMGYRIGCVALCRESGPPGWILWLGTAIVVSVLLTVLGDQLAVTSSLRPTENLYVVGVLLLLACFVSMPREPAQNNFFHLGLVVLSVVPLFFLRGMLSSLAWVLLSLSIFAPRLNSFVRSLGFSRLIFFSMFAAGLAIVNKSMLFRYTIYPLASSTPLNGRLQLLGNAGCFVTSEAIPVLGAFSSPPHDYWSHNLYIDTLLRHGWLPAFFLLAFIICVICDLRLDSWLVAMSLVLLFLGSLLQPVEFSDGISYQISFLVLGCLLSPGFQRYD